MTSDIVAILVIALTLAISVAILYRAMLRVYRIRTELVPPEVRDKSHEVKNEVMKTRAGLRSIASSPDPIRALIEATAGHRHDRLD